MFAIVALLCLYLGGNNIRKAFALATFSQWKAINWMLLVTGIAMFCLVPFLLRQAIRDYNLAKEDALAKEKRAEEKKKRQYMLDDSEDFDQ